jgi:uncharacterized membrane protein YbhN (UPF0104 family)
MTDARAGACSIIGVSACSRASGVDHPISSERDTDLSDLSLALAHSPPVADPITLRRFTARSIKIAVSIAALGAALALLAFNYDLSKVGQDLGALSPSIVAIVSIALLSNALVAVLRFKIIASDMGDAISWRRAMATVSAGSLAGALFFQIAGQLIARSTIMGRGGVPFANVVVITLYERAVAAVLSGLLAVAGAFLVFGRIYIDPTTGGADLIRLVIGLLAATAAGALLGYGRTALRSVVPLLSDRFAISLLRVFALTLCVQLPMMVAYVAIAHALSPEVAIADLVAAAAIVMFAASVPISLAGWGIREMSAVAALGLIGVEPCRVHDRDSRGHGLAAVDGGRHGNLTAGAEIRGRGPAGLLSEACDRLHDSFGLGAPASGRDVRAVPGLSSGRLRPAQRQSR